MFFIADMTNVFVGMFQDFRDGPVTAAHTILATYKLCSKLCLASIPTCWDEQLTASLRLDEIQIAGPDSA
jgi:hypothetical protein